MKISKFWKLYPKKNKNFKKIYLKRKKVSLKNIKKLQKFGKEYFDGIRDHGYGGYYYNKKFFRKIVKTMIKHYKLDNNSKILDIGCAKGFMMYDFKYFLPKAEIKGIDISSYCKRNALPSVKKDILVGNCKRLPFKNNYFDFVIAISTIHNLSEKDIPKSILEIQRVKKENGKSFLIVKGYKNKKEKKKIEDWNVAAKSNISIKKWKTFFKKSKYKGDFDFSNY